MKTVTIAFDVDGTLRCNCTDTCQDVNRRIVDLLYIFKSFKNVKVIVWSGGGADYARNFMAKFQDLQKGITYADKKFGGRDENGKALFAPDIKPDIAIDDIQDCELGTLNLIVKEK